MNDQEVGVWSSSRRWLRREAMEHLGPRGRARLLSAYWSVKSRRRFSINVDQLLYSTRSSGSVVYSPSLEGFTPRLLWEQPEEIFFWGYRPMPGDLVLDVGAGIGTEAIPLSRAVGQDGHVLAIEASPIVFSALKATASTNSLMNTSLVNAAISDVDGSILIREDVDDWIANSSSDSSGHQVQVEALRLDTLLRSRGLHEREIALLKINIEGAEVAALVGLGQCIGNVKNAVISCHDFRGQREANPQYRTYTAVRDLLLDQGFSVRSRRDPRVWVADTIYASRG